MSDSVKRYFTPEEAQRLVPRLQDLMGRVVERHAEMGRLRQAIEDAQRRVMLAGGMRVSQEFWRSSRAALSRATADLRARLQEVVGLGAVPKDLGLGLVDLPSHLENREINLCWRVGEAEIRFWHGLDEGYANRRPLPGTAGGT